MRVLLHIGQSKTGTSAIQAFLTLNRSSLREVGVLYPTVRIAGGLIDLGAHNAVADSLAGKSGFPHLKADQYFSQFFEEAQRIDAKLLILSAEHFFGGEPRIWAVTNHNEYFELYRQKVEKLATYLKGLDVSLLVYLRPQLDWLASAVSQTVRIDRLISETPIYQNDRQFFELMKPLLRYSALLDIWADVIKPSTFKVVPYTRNTLYKGSSISDFLRRTGLEKMNFPCANVDIQVNTSLTREYLEVKKIINRSPHGKNAERVIIRCLERLSEQSLESTRYGFSDDIQRDLESFIAPENARLNERYRSDNPSFVGRGPEQDRDQKPLSEEDVSRAMATFEREYRRPRYRLLSLNYASRALLRLYGKPVHGTIHRMKMSYLKMKFRNKQLHGG
ncbi:MAG: hypothetical protein JJE16_16815 [Nitrospiraceae bacterium]|nr:hypothetical protein [Nitrospiraceae bacterium]